MSTMILQVSMLKPSDLMSWPRRKSKSDGKIPGAALSRGPPPPDRNACLCFQDWGHFTYFPCHGGSRGQRDRAERVFATSACVPADQEAPGPACTPLGEGATGVEGGRQETLVPSGVLVPHRARETHPLSRPCKHCDVACLRAALVGTDLFGPGRRPGSAGGWGG